MNELEQGLIWPENLIHLSIKRQLRKTFFWIPMIAVWKGFWKRFEYTIETWIKYQRKLSIIYSSLLSWKNQKYEWGKFGEKSKVRLSCVGADVLKELPGAFKKYITVINIWSIVNTKPAITPQNLISIITLPALVSAVYKFLYRGLWLVQWA